MVPFDLHLRDIALILILCFFKANPLADVLAFQVIFKLSLANGGGAVDVSRVLI